MTIADFEATVAAFMNRPLASWTVGGIDLILQALNDVRRAAQRDYTFEMFQQRAFIQLSFAGADIMSAFKADDSGAGATVKVRVIRAMWEYTKNTDGTYSRTKQLDLRDQAAWKKEVPLRTTWPFSVAPNFAIGEFAYMEGTKLYHSRTQSAQWYMADVIAWQADLAAGDTPDIFLVYFPDWLKWAVIAQLNGYLKEDQRVVISATAMASAWENVKQLDAQITASTSAWDGD